jgi:hypothetical protein
MALLTRDAREGKAIAKGPGINCTEPSAHCAEEARDYQQCVLASARAHSKCAGGTYTGE